MNTFFLTHITTIQYAVKFSNLPETPPQGAQNWECWDISGFLKCPVVRGKRSSQGHLSKGNNEIH